VPHRKDRLGQLQTKIRGVDIREATDLIVDAVEPQGRRSPEVWADFGAGDGTFTAALADLLPPGSRIYAVDRDPRAVKALARRAAERAAVAVVTVLGDVTRPIELPGLDGRPLDGMILANTLHFISGAAATLERLVRLLRPGGRVVLVEYDRRAASRWVPYPISATQLPELAASAGLAPPVITARRPSAFGGELYVAMVRRPVS